MFPAVGCQDDVENVIFFWVNCRKNSENFECLTPGKQLLCCLHFTVFYPLSVPSETFSTDPSHQTSSRFRFTRSVYVQVIPMRSNLRFKTFFNSWMSTMSQRGISAVQTFCFQEVANQKKGEERRWSQAEDGLMGFTTDSIKIDMAIWPDSQRFILRSLWLSCLFHVSRSESKDKHMEIVMIVTGPLATQTWSSFKMIGITLNPSSVQTTFRYVDVGFQLSRSLWS